MNLHTMPFPPQRRTRDWRPALFLLSAVVIVADRLTKLWIVHHIRGGFAIVVIPGVFRLTHVLNSGAAFSIFADSVSPNAVRWGLIGFSIVAVLIVFGMLLRTGRYLNVSTVALALILGGAIGNLYDRARLYYVVDFLEVTILHYHWPDFNVADSCIVIGACLLLLEIVRPQTTSRH
jgi:signal peptidase II